MLKQLIRPVQEYRCAYGEWPERGWKDAKLWARRTQMLADRAVIKLPGPDVLVSAFGAWKCVIDYARGVIVEPTVEAGLVPNAQVFVRSVEDRREAYLPGVIQSVVYRHSADKATTSYVVRTYLDWRRAPSDEDNWQDLEYAARYVFTPEALAKLCTIPPKAA